jgi:hypothetical protein
MKIYYTENDITNTAAQLMMCSVCLDGSISNIQDQRFKRAFPDAYYAMLSMIKSNVEEKLRPHIGDVIWVNPGGNRTIGFSIVRESSSSSINIKALRAVIKSAHNKAKEMGIQYVGMGLFACDTPQEWGSIVTIIEKELGDVQGVVCIPTNDALLKVLDSLPGSKDFVAVRGN